MIDSIISAFVAKQRELLELELQAENEEEKELVAAPSPTRRGGGKDGDKGEERASHILGNLEASGMSVGLYGRTVVQLTPWSASVEQAPTTTASSTRKAAPGLLPAHRFTVGDEVEIRAKGVKGSSSSKSNNVGGVISAVSDTFVAVALFSDRSASQERFQTSNRQQPSSSKSGSKSSADTTQEEEEASILNQAPLTLVPKSSVDVHRKLLSALSNLEKRGVDHPLAGRVIQAMFHPSYGVSPSPSAASPKLEPFNPHLDQSQLDAIAFALQPDRPVALIHGPPGTGKTTTVAELIRQAVHHHGMRVLVTAPSNVAVDNILERLVAVEGVPATKSAHGKRGSSAATKQQSRRRLRTVRLGHPARIKSSILSHSLEALVQASEGTEIVQDVRQELQSFLKILSNPKSRGQDKRVAYREVKSLRKEVRVREEKVVHELIASADVVLATTVGAANRILDRTGGAEGTGDGPSPGFDLVIIDEAAQALETSCWIPILRGRKVVLAGDHCQLPPTIKSKNRMAVAGLSQTMFERLMKLYDGTDGKEEDASSQRKSCNGHQISRMLQIQYRMHHDIADWASQAMYRGGLLTHESVRNRTLGQLPSVQEATKTRSASSTTTGPNDFPEENIRDTVLLLVDTAGCDMHEQTTVAGSRYNEGEAEIVCQHVRALLELGVEQDQVAIITPYNGQVELLRTRLLPDFPKLEIRSVDGFQGGEREAVVLSLVRSSAQGGKNGIGFLQDDRRQNVAVTRAKRHLAVVCDTETVSQSPFIRNLVSWIEEHGEQRSAVEYMAQSTTTDYDGDLLVAEAHLMNLVDSSFPNSVSKQQTEKNLTRKDEYAHSDKAIDDAKRKSLMDKIAAFAKSGIQGDEMALSSELTSYDRRLVHEFAEQLNLGHRSEGTEHIDRRIILTIQNHDGRRKDIEMLGLETTSAASVEIREYTSEDRERLVAATSQVPSFAALVLDASDSDESDSEDAMSGDIVFERLRTGGEETTNDKEPMVPAANLLLSQLAAGRAARQQQQQQSSLVSSIASVKKNKVKPSGQKLGGSAPKSSPQKNKDISLDGLDDMAFLDAQIEKSQNEHGRKVVGAGKSYRTLVNGVLNSRPELRPKPTNDRASAALQSKLKEAEKARKAKNTNNKKK